MKLLLCGLGSASCESTAMLLSVETVQFHLTRTYAKLGLRSRAELAAHLPRATTG